MENKIINIFDSHAHYDDSAFDADRDEVLEEIQKLGVIGVINCGASLEGARMSVELSNQHDFMYSAVGIHPENAGEYNLEVEKEFKNLISSNGKIRAIGEIGLDYYWEENPPRELQKEVFKKQMKLAEDLSLPVIIHDRDAHKDTLEIMKEFPNVRGVVHCFSGSVEFAKECLDLGYYIGFTGVVTFKNAKKILDVAKEVPLERMLVETDAPYMAPVPNRGKRNQSNYILSIIDKLAEIKGMDINDISQIFIKNTRSLFEI